MTGGMDERHNLAPTETLMKNGGTAWQPVKALPTARGQLAGVGLDHGRFVVTGGLWCRILMMIFVCEEDLYILILFVTYIIDTCSETNT